MVRIYGLLRYPRSRSYEGVSQVVVGSRGS